MTPSPKAAPRRVQRSRKKGSRLPENTVVVTRPSQYGNPFVIGGHFKRGGMAIPRLGIRAIYIMDGDVGLKLTASTRRRATSRRIAHL